MKRKIYKKGSKMFSSRFPNYDIYIGGKNSKKVFLVNEDGTVYKFRHPEVVEKAQFLGEALLETQDKAGVVRQYCLDLGIRITFPPNSAGLPDNRLKEINRFLLACCR